MQRGSQWLGRTPADPVVISPCDPQLAPVDPQARFRVGPKPGEEVRPKTKVTVAPPEATQPVSGPWTLTVRGRFRIGQFLSTCCGTASD